MINNYNYWWTNDHYTSYEDGGIKRGFNDWGCRDRYRKSIERKVKIGDKIVIYITKVMLFGGILEVLSKMYYDETRPLFPWRFKTKPIILSPLQHLPSAKPIFSRLEIIDPTNPGSRIQGAIKTLSEKDYLTIYNYLKDQPNIALYDEHSLSSFEEHKDVKEIKKQTILNFLSGKPDKSDINDGKICEWIEFCYRNGMHKEAVRLINYVDQGKVDTEIYKKAKKIVDVSSMKIGFS